MATLQSPVLTCPDAVKLINLRNNLPLRMYVSVKGKVTAMSEMLRMKQDDFFMLELDHDIYVLVKDFLLDWHPKLCPLTTVVFHHLRLTTIEKGVMRPRPILTAWRPSRVTVEPGSSSVPCVDFQQWFATVATKTLKDDSPITTETEDCYEVAMTEKCVHLEARVVDLSLYANRVVVLEGGTRLFTGLMPTCPFDLGQIREGMRIHIYNAHLHSDSEKTLVACCHSLIRLEQLPTSTSSTGEKEEQRISSARTPLKDPPISTEISASYPAKSFIQKFGLTFGEAQAFLALHQHLEDGKRQNVPKLLDNILKSDVCGGVCKVSLTPIDLFLNHRLLCPMADAQSSLGRVPWVQSVLQLRQMSRRKCDNLAKGGLEFDDKTSSESSRHWSFFHRKWEDKEILVGYLVLSKLGQLRFVDKTGHMPIVLTQEGSGEEDDHLSDMEGQREGLTGVNIKGRKGPNGKRSDLKGRSHACCLKCVAETKARVKCVCPFISQGMLSKMLVIRKYHLACEFYVTSSSEKSDSSADKFSTGLNPQDDQTKTTKSSHNSSVIYLLVSLLDCVFLERASLKQSAADFFNTSVKKNISSRDKSDKSQNFSKFVNHTEQFTSCLMHVSAKESIVASGAAGAKFKVTGNLINRDAWDSFQTESSFSDESQFPSRDSPPNRCSHGDSSRQTKRRLSAGLGNPSDFNLNREEEEEEVNNNNKEDTVQDVNKFNIVQNGCNELRANENKTLNPTNQKELSELSELSGKKIKLTQATSVVDCSPPSLDTRPVMLVVSGEAVCSYPFFAVNKFCEIKIPSVKEDGSTSRKNKKCDPFKPVFSNQNVERTLLRSKSSVFIDIKEKMIVEKAVRKLLDEEDAATSKFLKFSEVLQISDTASTVSLRGVIHAREALESSFSSKGSGSGASEDLKLVVGDLDAEDDATIHIYFKSFRSLHLLGLIPGAVIDFRCLERKVSLKGNVYCKFGVASSFSLHGFSNPGDVEDLSRPKTWLVDDLPKTFLIHIWQTPPKARPGVPPNPAFLDARGKPCRIHCRVCCVFRLTLKTVCAVCKGIFLQDACQSRGCRNTDDFSLKTYAVVLVDDGTCQASVKMFSEKLVQKLLTLTDEQWTDLVTDVRMNGEILVFMCDPWGSSQGRPVERFLRQLVRSPLVARPWVMAVRRTRDSPSSASVADMQLEEFKVKDIRVGRVKVPSYQLPLLQLECLSLKEAMR